MGGQWWKVDVGLERPIGPIQSEFITLFLAQGGPQGAALFCDVLGHRGTAIFFSPGAAAIAGSVLLRYGGRPCDQPAEGIFLAGHEHGRALLKQPTRQ